MKLYFIPLLKELSLNKKYVLYSIFYGLTTLIIPLAVQLLVNNLALAGIWVNTLTFIIIILVGLTLTQCFKYGQIILTEYLQRELFMMEVKKWAPAGHSENGYYFFEVLKVLSNFSKAFTNLVEFGLVLVFGMVTIVLFHPGFLLLPLLIGCIIAIIFSSSDSAIKTSIEESDRKYDIFYLISDNKKIDDTHVDRYLLARDKHFRFIKRNAILVAVAYILSQLVLLGLGIYFIQVQELSVGQLVSAEIILSGILASSIKLPQTMENLYDFETSKYKISKGLGELQDANE